MAGTATVEDFVVTASGVTKNYGKLTAVKAATFSVRRGEIFGLIGPDGAGKTTIFHMLGGILAQTAGDITVLGKSAADARLQIGYLTQQFSLYPDLSVEENIQYASGLRSVPKVEFEERKNRYLNLMDLARFSDRLAGRLSGGMKQKLALCCALIARPELLLLDEPTTGVDPVSRRDFWDILAAIAGEGVSVAVATPYMDEAERCSRIALIYQGVIQQIGSPRELKESVGLSRLEVRGAPLKQIARLTAPLMRPPEHTVTEALEFGDRVDLLVREPDSVARIVSDAAKSEGFELSISKQEPTLENIFALKIGSLESHHEDEPFEFSKDLAPKQGEAIAAKMLTKRFGGFVAVKDVNISIGYGRIYGLLGANGAGKTTTIKMLCGLLEPTSGEMILAGQRSDLRSPALRRHIGYMSQKFTLYDDLSVMENLRFYAGLYDVEPRLERSRIDWVLETTGLRGAESMLTRALPGGFKQRLAFGATVLHQPSILFLDEPTSGVDPLARRELWKLVSQFAQQGTAVLVTTHFLEEAEYCHGLGFMVAGELVANGSPEEIKRSQPGKLLEVRTTNNQAASNLLKQALDDWRISIFADALHVVVDEETNLDTVRSVLSQHQISIVALRDIPFSLEDCFIGIVERAKQQAVAA